MNWQRLQSQLKHFLVLLLMISFFLLPYFAFAGEEAPNTASLLKKAAGENGARFDTSTGVNISKIIGQVINTFLSILGIIFLILMFYAGYLWMMAQGNDDQVNKAKSLIRNAIIGLVIIIAAYAITYFVIKGVLDIPTGGGGGGSTG